MDFQNLASKEILKPLNITTWESFFSLTGGSIFYCLSALSIIYGIARILGPMLAKTNVLRDAYPCLAALNIYELALLGVLVFIVVWEKVTDDALSLVVLVALFLIGSGLTLSTVANSDSHVSLIFGTVFFCVGAVKLHVLKRYVGLAFELAVVGRTGCHPCMELWCRTITVENRRVGLS